MSAWNIDLFLFINASVTPSASVVSGLGFLASSPVVVCLLLLVGLWVWGPPSARGGLLAVAATMVLDQGINLALGQLWFEPRPFMVGLGRTLITHAPDNAFPSDHVTFVLTLGFGLIATRASRRWGTMVCVYGAAVAWIRIYLGVHFPIDMVTSAAVAVVGGQVARMATPGIAVWVLPAIENLYETVLVVAHLPPGLVPRCTRLSGSGETKV